MRIIAFGDSLTVGYQSPTPENPTGQATPYGRFLQDLMGEGAVVKIRGINGELTGQMVSRFERDVVSRSPDCVIILGGANDVGWGVPPAEIMANLSTLYDRATVEGIQAVAVTLPSIRGFDALIPPRQQLNQMIMENCKSRGIPCVDLFSATAEPDTHCLAERYSNDGLHMTTEGYRCLADLIYRSVFKT